MKNVAVATTSLLNVNCIRIYQTVNPSEKMNLQKVALAESAGRHSISRMPTGICWGTTFRPQAAG